MLTRLQWQCNPVSHNYTILVQVNNLCLSLSLYRLPSCWQSQAALVEHAAINRGITFPLDENWFLLCLNCWRAFFVSFVILIRILCLTCTDLASCIISSYSSDNLNLPKKAWRPVSPLSRFIFSSKDVSYDHRHEDHHTLAPIKSI